METRTAAPSVDVGAVHPVPKAFRLERVFADDYLCETGCGGVRKGTVNGPFYRHRIRVDLPDSGNSRIRFDPDDQSILSAVAKSFHLFLTQIDGFDSGYFHALVFGSFDRRCY